MSKSPSPESARAWNAALRDADPATILAWVAAEFRGRVALTMSFGGPGVALAHMLSEMDVDMPVIFLDTGMLHSETDTFRREFAARYSLRVVVAQPEADPGPLYATDPDRCCTIRKVAPMARAIADFDAWVSSIRRDQGATRSNTEVVEYHELDGRALVKVHPLAYWDRATVWRYITDNDIPYHPLLDQGYSSLGCWPCTRRTRDGEDERAGRWSGTDKTECGLHTFTNTSGRS
jgi:phosphoadenosine phosphosulfate reductase